MLSIDSVCVFGITQFILSVKIRQGWLLPLVFVMPPRNRRFLFARTNTLTKPFLLYESEDIIIRNSVIFAVTDGACRSSGRIARTTRHTDIKGERESPYLY